MDAPISCGSSRSRRAATRSSSRASKGRGGSRQSRSRAAPTGSSTGPTIRRSRRRRTAGCSSTGWSTPGRRRAATATPSASPRRPTRAAPGHVVRRRLPQRARLLGVPLVPAHGAGRRCRVPHAACARRRHERGPRPHQDGGRGRSGPTARWRTRQIVDGDACSCCSTDMAETVDGPVAVYRDHDAGEIRDISIVRRVDGKWTAPAPVHRDGWMIAGCPTNGPAVAASGLARGGELVHRRGQPAAGQDRVLDRRRGHVRRAAFASTPAGPWAGPMCCCSMTAARS